MQQLTFVKPGRVEWRSVPEPKLNGPAEALVRPVIAARCDGDNLPLFHNLTAKMRAGVALHYLDPVTTDLLGPYPYGRPFAIGHECIGEVVECGDEVTGVTPGQLVIVPWAVSCGSCGRCSEGLTSKCSEAGSTLVSGYGFGEAMGPWGGMVSDLVRVPFADGMLVPVPDGVDPLKLASASDNMPDAWRSVAQPLARIPEAPVLIVGGGAQSIGLYAAGMAAALGASRVDYLDHSRSRLEIAELLGANPVEIHPGARWFHRNAPRTHGEFRIAVEASSTVAGLRYAVRSLAPGGICTAVGFYFEKRAGLPLMQMYANSTTLEVSLGHARAHIPDVVDFVARGAFDPLKVTTLVADWDDAPEAYTTRTTKLVLSRFALSDRSH